MWPRASYVPSTCLSFFICRKEMVTVKRCSMIMRTNRDNIGEAFGKLIHRKFSGIIFYMHFILFCITVPGVPKITLKFGNLLEGPAELRKDVLLTVSLLQQKNTDENMTALSQWSLIVPATTCDNAHDILPTMAARLSLGVTSFCWGGQACRHGHPSWMTWATQPPGPNGGRTGKVRHTAPGKQKQAFAQNHIFSINYLAWPKAPGIQRHFNQAVYSKGLGVISQEPVKGQYFLWNAQVWVLKLARLSLYCIINNYHVQKEMINT